MHSRHLYVPVARRTRAAFHLRSCLSSEMQLMVEGLGDEHMKMNFSNSCGRLRAYTSTAKINILIIWMCIIIAIIIQEHICLWRCDAVLLRRKIFLVSIYRIFHFNYCVCRSKSANGMWNYCYVRRQWSRPALALCSLAIVHHTNRDVTCRSYVNWYGLQVFIECCSRFCHLIMDIFAANDAKNFAKCETNLSNEWKCIRWQMRERNNDATASQTGGIKIASNPKGQTL